MTQREGEMTDFPAVLDLATLAAGDGSTGFVLNGIDEDDFSGDSVSSAGDVNGDGFDDVIIGAGNADPGGVSGAGESYVVFGSASGPGASFELSSLANGNGSAGFVLNGIDMTDNSGFSVSSAGDVNGNGFDDVIIGAWIASLNGDNAVGETYVVFGKANGFTPSFDLSDLASGNGSAGFVLNGIDASDRSGRSVSSAGDVNGDGFDDVIIGAASASPEGRFIAGESYVVFGKASGFGASFELSGLANGDGSAGFVLNGASSFDGTGGSVSSAGDVNGDGFDDLIVGASTADSESGEAYIVFGKATGFSATLDYSTLDGTNGFQLNGISARDQSGYSVASAGDVNGDGFDDIIVGAYGADNESGESYVIFGKASGFRASFNLSNLTNGNGSTGFVLNGIDAGDESGRRVSSAGDVNGDGFDDLIIGARRGDPDGNSNAGESYLVFGRASGFGASFDLETLANGDGTDGFVLSGADTSDFSGNSVSSAGDVNGDGIDDIVISAPGGNSGSGESYVIYGRTPTEAVTRIGSAADQTIYGSGFDDVLGGLAGSDVLLGGAGDDHLEGGAEADTLSGSGGSDTASYESSNARVTVNLTTGEATGGHATGDVLIQIENLTGSRFADTLTGNAADNVLEGGRGSDMLFGRSGDDTFISGVGADMMVGGSGRGDTVDYSTSSAAVDVGVDAVAVNLGGHAAGDDLIGIENLTGSAFADSITGNSVRNTLHGGEGSDTILASSNNDMVFGEGGDDILSGGRGADMIDGGSGSDTATYGSSDLRVTVDLVAGTAVGSGHGSGDTLIDIENVLGSRFNDRISGNAEANALTGGRGNDTILGGGGNDVLSGQAGNDRLTGGGGDDVLRGGAGADRFIYDDLSFGEDTITGWQNGQDLLDFRALGLDHSDFTETASGGGTLLTLTSDPAQSVFLAGINPNTIDDNDFL